MAKLTEKTKAEWEEERIDAQLNRLSKPVKIARELETLVDELYDNNKIDMDIRVKFHKISSKVREL